MEEWFVARSRFWGLFGPFPVERRVGEGFSRKKGMRTVKTFMLTNESTPTSHMSRTRPSNILANTSPFGRFFVDWPITKKEASFFLAQNSRDERSSNGRMIFFLENDMALGRLRAI